MNTRAQTIINTTDAAAGALWLGVLTSYVPVVLGVLGILWFLIRFVNLVRVNVCGKETWKGMG